MTTWSNFFPACSNFSSDMCSFASDTILSKESTRVSIADFGLGTGFAITCTYKYILPLRQTLARRAYRRSCPL